MLTVESKIPGQMIINGIDFIFFKKCKIMHLFSKKIKKRLYVYRPKYYSRKHSDDEEVYKNLKSKTDIKDNYHIKKRRRTSSMYKKRKLEYEIKDLNEDLFISFPKGDIIDVYLYQFFLFPISITNNSSNVKIKRTSIFLENSDNKKIKTFFKYITKNIYINPKHNNEIFVIPLIPIKLGEVYIKIIIKFEDEIRVKPVEIRRAIIKINVKESISFELKETYNNYLNNFEIKNDLRIIKNGNWNKLEIKEPLYNKNEFKMINYEEDFKNEDEMHVKYSFKNMTTITNNTNKTANKYNLDFINQELERENINIITNNHIIEKFNKILNNSKNKIIFFPWKVLKNINNKSNTTIFCIYPYIVKLERPKPTKSIIKELLINSTKVEIIKHKINNKSLVIITFSIDKSILFSFSNTIYKYEIFINEENPEIIWIGGKKYVIMNNIKEEDEINFECRFNFLTELKGLIEINRISIKFYKKGENLEGTEETLLIKHMIKPFSIYIE